MYLCIYMLEEYFLKVSFSCQLSKTKLCTHRNVCLLEKIRIQGLISGLVTLVRLPSWNGASACWLTTVLHSFPLLSPCLAHVCMLLIIPHELAPSEFIIPCPHNNPALFSSSFWGQVWVRLLSIQSTSGLFSFHWTYGTDYSLKRFHFQWTEEVWVKRNSDQTKACLISALYWWHIGYH